MDPGFVLAGLDGMIYESSQLRLGEGDTLFLYTDGVTEAQDQEQQLFGEERLLESLNAGVTLSVEELCAKVKADAAVEQKGDQGRDCHKAQSPDLDQQQNHSLSKY